MVCGSGCAGVAVPWVTSIRACSGRIMSIPISTGGDSRPMMIIKLALPLASPHCRLRCWVFPAIWRGLLWVPWTTPLKGFKGPHWAMYCHHTENPIQVTEAPVSTRPRTGVPSRLSWPVMGGPTTHPTEATLASGDPSNSLTARWGWDGSRLLEAAAPGFVLVAGRGHWRVLAGEEDGGQSGRTVGHEVAFFSAEEAAQRSTIHLTAGRAVEWSLFAVILIDVASGGNRWQLSGCSGCCGWSGDSGHGGHRWGRGFVGSELLIGFFQILFEKPDLILHGADQALHFGVGLFLKDLLHPTSSCDDVLHRPMSQFLYFCSQGLVQGPYEGVHSVTFGGFFVSGVESLGEFFRLASELHNVLGSFLEVLKCCPGFVSY